MKIEKNINLQSFKSRAAIVKEADKVCREINSTFPHISPSYSWVNFNKPVEYDHVFSNIENKLKFIRHNTGNAISPLDYYKKLFKLVKKFKCANCGELADIAYLYCKNKNFDNVRIVGIYGCNKNKKSLIDYDHVAVAFKSGNKELIIDPWFGIADYAKNCLVKYKQKYHEFFQDFEPDLDIIIRTEDRVEIEKSDMKKVMNLYSKGN